MWQGSAIDARRGTAGRFSQQCGALDRAAAGGGVAVRVPGRVGQRGSASSVHDGAPRRHRGRERKRAGGDRRETLLAAHVCESGAWERGAMSSRVGQHDGEGGDTIVFFLSLFS
jgi:hypothetical protein|eukprot:gene6847-biopygen8797